jgi:phytoene desaturase
MTTAQIAIVGAGPGGLAAAVLLAHAGANVTLFERNAVVGGRTSALEVDGFRFDTGPTFFLYPRVLEEILETVGRDLHQETELLRLDPHYQLLFESGGGLRATPDPARMRAEIARLAPEDAAGFDLYMADNRRKLRAFEPVLQMPFPGPRTLFDRRMLSALPLLRLTRTVDTDLARFFRDPRVRLAFSFQSKYLGMSPYRCPSLFTILSFLEYEYGVFHPVGGCAALMEMLAGLAVEMGVDLRLCEPVRGFRFDGRRVEGVVTDKGVTPTDGVVINADFCQSMVNLVPEELRPRWSNRKIERSKLSCSTFMMYLGVKGPLPELEHHTIWLSDEYGRNFDEIEAGERLFDTPSFYVQNACRNDPSLAPPGYSTLYVLVPVAHMSPHIDWSTARDVYRRVAYRQLARLGLKDLESRVVVERIRTPSDWQDDLGIYKGATFNLAHSLDQMLSFRPRNRFGDLDGVYLVGGGTHPGSGLPVIFESARITAGLMTRDLGLSGRAEPVMAPRAEAAE